MLPNLTQKSVIILDNASHHKKRFGCDKSVGLMKKAEVISKLQQHRTPIDENITAAGAKTIPREHYQWNVPYEIVYMANQKGHVVLFTTPHYSDLQPIEYLWAHIKSGVGRQYSNTTTMTDVKERLDSEFNSLFSEQGQELIIRII